MSDENKKGKLDLFKLDDIKLGSEEVINVFISKWEDELYGKKKEYSKSVSDVKKKIEGWENKIINEGKKLGRSLERVIEDLNVKVVFKDKVEKYEKNVSIDYDDELIVVNVKIMGMDNGRNNGGLLVVKNYKINRDDVREYEVLSDELVEEKRKLEEVLLEIRNISRKERKIKGVISEKKLESEGYDELLNDNDINSILKLEG